MKRIEINNLSFSFKHQLIFNQVSLSVEQGEIMGITGPNGVGKSVFFKLIAGLLFPQSGEIIVNGIKLDNNSFPHSLGVMIEDPGFIDRLSGYDNLQMLASINNVIGDSEIEAVLKLVGLWDSRNKKTKFYSLGMKKKLGIAQAIMENPHVIILDEPMNALDSESVFKIKSIIKDLAHNQGATILIASHNQSDINDLCDVVYKVENHDVQRIN